MGFMELVFLFVYLFFFYEEHPRQAAGNHGEELITKKSFSFQLVNYFILHFTHED